MPERERFAWIWLAALAIGYGPYFAIIALRPAGDAPGLMAELRLLGAVTVFQMMTLGVSALVARLRRRGPPPRADERDRAIERRSAAVGYYVLIAGMILVGCIMPLSPGEDGWRIVHTAILAIVLAEVCHHGLIVLAYRRGWHG